MTGATPCKSLAALCTFSMLAAVITAANTFASEQNTEQDNISDGILIAAKHYISAGLAEPEYALQLSSILCSGTLPSTAPAVQSGFVSAMNKAILQQDYIAYAYMCAGAMECGIPNVVPSAFANIG
ncbi:TPA: hypothetical protein ACH3X3_008532 [Trebouxia sp. C0006]